MITELTGRTAVITGGASGIGLAIASACKAAGMEVVIADIEEAAITAACGALGAVGVHTDVTDPDSVAALAEAVRSRFGVCDLLLNNAGVGGGGYIVDQTLHDWNWVIDVNLKGVVHVLHAFLPSMLENPNGAHIVNTASIAGIAAVVSAHYTANKYAVVGISESMRHEFSGTGLGVSVLCPGLVRTNIIKSERNRPERLANPTTSRRKQPWALPRDNPLVVLEPSAIADLVLDAVRTDKFWILSDPGLLQTAWPRYEELRSIAFPA